MDDARLAFHDDLLTASSGGLERRWRLKGGLLYAESLRHGGHEWLRPGHCPSLVPPGGAPKPPLTVAWTAADGRARPVEAPSRRGALEVRGGDGHGWRLHLQVFPGLPAVVQRMEVLGPVADAQGAVGDITPASGVESDPEALLALGEGDDLCERFELACHHPHLLAVELADRTDQHDNLAAERRWRLSPVERVGARTCLAAVEDPLAGAGLALLKLAPLPHARPAPCPCDVLAHDRTVLLLGHGAGDTGQGYAWAVLPWKGGPWARAAALHALQAHLRVHDPARDGLLISNTWGDRNRDGRLTTDFARLEIEAGAQIGVDVCQLDDGWQRGVTANSVNAQRGGVWIGFWAADPQFWEPHPQRFPHGLEPVAKAASAAGLGLGLWYAPDSADDFANWQRDADQVLALHRALDVRQVKIDGVKAHSKRAEGNLHRFLDAVLAGSGGAVAFDLDVTAETRPGYFGAVQAGPLFVENRYSDWHRWWPHATLRNLWQLAWHVPPQRLRIEFLNPRRHRQLYQGDPLAPDQWPLDYPFATTLVANPLAWCEVSQLDVDMGAALAVLARTWKRHRAELHAGTILPVGECPDGTRWTGFCSAGSGHAHVLCFREFNTVGSWSYELPIPAGEWTVQPIAGAGSAQWSDGRLHVDMREPRRWAWFRLERTGG